eukprot:1515055-Prymnesium_polylepis.1
MTPFSPHSAPTSAAIAGTPFGSQPSAPPFRGRSGPPSGATVARCGAFRPAAFRAWSAARPASSTSRTTTR